MNTGHLKTPIETYGVLLRKCTTRRGFIQLWTIDRQNSSIEVERPMLFDRIRSIRHADQYSFQAKPTAEEVRAGIDLAEMFLNRMEGLLRETRGEKL